MSLLTRNATVATRYGGGFVQSIDGLAGGQQRRPAGRLVLLRQRHRGVQGRGVDERASGRSHLVGLARLERDRRHPRGRRLVPAAVSQRHRRQAPAGARGMRERRRLGVSHGRSRDCARSTCPRRSPRSARARARPRRCASPSAPGARSPACPTCANCAPGPQASGVYARFSVIGHGAHAARRRRAPRADAVGAARGLIAATRTGEDAPVWAVTGTDTAGVERAASALRQRDAAANRFAVAVGASGAARTATAGGVIA